MSDLNNQNEMGNVFAESSARQKQRIEQRQQNLDRYQVFVTDEQYDILNGLISQSDDPTEIENEGYRVANAMKYSEMYGIELADAYRDLDMLNAANFGEGAFNTPKDAFMAVVDSFTQGVKQMERNSVGKQIREAEEAGNDRRVQELYQTIAGIDEEIAGLQDTQSRNIITKMFKYGAQSLPYTGAAIATSAVGGLLGGGIGAVVLGTMSSYEAMRGEEYLQLREDGASVDTAGKIADASALLQGIVEVSLGTVAGYAGNVVGKSPVAKAASDKITRNVFSRMYYGGAWKRAAAVVGKLGVDFLSEANEEGLEEVIQELVSSGARALSAELEDYDVDGLTASEVAQNAWESYKGGFLGALVLGAPNIAFNAKATVQDFKDFNSAAQNIESKEAFIKETSNSPLLDGMSDEAKVQAQEEVYAKFEPQRNKRAEAERALAEDRAEVIDTSDNVEETVTDESGRVVREDEYRNEDGSLNYVDRVYDTNEDGSTENQLIVKGKGNQEYGRIMYNEDADGNIVISDFTMSPTRENLRQEVFTDFAEKFAGRNIEWETRGNTAASVRESLVNNNVRGSQNGLSYFADKNEVANQKTRMSWDRQIREAIPSMTSEQRSTGIALVESFANKHGKSLAEYDMDIFNGKLFLDKASREAYETALSQGMNPDNIGGYVDIEELGKSTKGIIYAAKKGDATTFVHENAHIFRRLLTADEMAQAEKLFNVTDHNWTRQNEEDFAYALQGYAFEGKAVGEAEPLFRKLAQALVRVYNSLKGKIDFNPELSDFIEGLFADPSTALAQAQRAVEQNERASQNQLSNNSLQLNETESVIDDTNADVSERVEEAINKAGDDVLNELYQFIDVKGAMNLTDRVKTLYDRAEEMRDNGADKETIRKLTGYSEGPDGVFQYELDDSQNEIIDRDGMQKAINAASFMSRAMANPGVTAQNLELLQYAMDKQLELLNAEKNTVGKIYKAGELYTAKPELKNIRVGFVYDPRRIRAVQFEGGIGVNLAYIQNLEDLQGALVHELQHIIDLKVNTAGYNGDFFSDLNYAMEAVELNNKEYYADLVDDGGIVQYFLTDPYERNAHAAQRRMNLTAAQRRAYKLSDVVNNNYLFQTQDTDSNGMLRIKHGITKANAIADYLEERLNSWGYETRRDASTLSNSQYITITNYSEKTGKESKYNVDELKIRISDHDLPPSYDGLNGYEDYDLRSGKKNTNRPGTGGNATTYDVALQNLWDELKEKPKSDNVDISDLPEWARNIGDTYEAFKASGRIPLLVSEVVNGGTWSKNKKPNKTQQYERLKKILASSAVGNSLVDIISAYDGFEDNIRTAKAIESKYNSSESDTVRAQYEGTDQWMKAPNGADTKLTENQWLQVRTESFKNWFGDWESDPQNASKVVDENGEPMVVYHGTEHSGFDTFNFEDGNLSFFTPNKAQAVSYAGTEEIAVNGTDKRGIYASFMSLKNPKVIDFNGADFQGFNENGDSVIDTFTDEEAYKAREEGYDGIIIRNVYNDYGDYQHNIDPKEEMKRNFINDEYVSFSSSQIKSTTDNNGNFDAENDSILFQDITETDNFKAWFGDWQNDPENASKVVDENGRPKVVYHGTARGDRVGNVFDPKRATSGPMAFFTDDKEVATSYSKNKKDTSISRDYDSYDDIRRFTVKIGKKKVPIDRAWFSLEPEQREALRENSGKITTDEDGNIIVVEGNEDGLGNFAYTRKEYRGDILKALYDHWVMSGQLFGDDVKMFPEVLKKAGLSDVFYEDPDYREEKVYEVYLNLRNPLVTSNVSNELVDALHEAGKKAQRKYDREKATFADAWDKSNVSPEEWLEDFDNDYAEGTTYVWTRVPDWVTKVLKDFGYDGIQDDGGKFHENKHNVYIPFNSYQIKSAYENRGTFDPTKKNILYQTVYHGSAADFDRFDTENYGLSGEGSMSFGYGTYVTESEKIARDYAMRQANDKYLVGMANDMLEHIESGFRTFEEEKQNAIEWYSKWKKYSIENPVRAKELKAKYDFAKSLNSLEDLKNASNPEGKRHLYTIDIPDDGYIKWDDTISSKTVDKVKEELFNKLAYEPNSDGEYEYKGVEKQLKKDLDDVFDSEYTGRSLYGTVSSYLGGDKEASKFLSSIGYVGIDYPAGTNYGNGNDARNFVIFNDNDAEITGKLLFQYLQGELDADTLKEAADFTSWEEWYEYAKAMDTDGVLSGAWDDVSEQNWFKSAWESAQKIYNAEPAEDPELQADKDKQFVELIKKPGYLEDFLERAKRYMGMQLDQPSDEAEAAEFDRIRDMQRFTGNVMADPVHYTNDLDDTQKKKLLTMIESSPREYRAIYAEVFGDANLEVPEGMDYTIDTSVMPEEMALELDAMTPAQRREAVKAVEDEQIRQQIESGSLPMDTTLDRYIKVVDADNKKLKKEIEKLKSEYREDLARINNAQKKALLEEYERLQEMAAEMQGRNLKGNSRVSSGLSAGAMATSNVVDASENGSYNTVMDRIASLKKMFAGERDAAAIIAKADERAKQKVLQQKKKAEADALREMKKLRTNTVKRMVRKVSFTNVNYDEAKKIIAIQNFIDHWVRNGVNLWLGEAEVTASEIYNQYTMDSDFRDEVDKTLTGRKAGARGQRVLRNLRDAMSDDEGLPFSQWTPKMKNELIEALGTNDQVIRLNLDALKKQRQSAIHSFIAKNGTITEENMKTVYESLPKDVIARIRYTPMNKWTLAQAEELARYIDAIYEDGKKIYAGRQQLRRDRYEELRRRIQDAVKDTGIRIEDDDTPEEIKKKQEKIAKILGLRTQGKGTAASAAEKRSMREKFMAADRGTGNVRRFARVMDNWTEGVFTDTLCFSEYMAWDDEQKAINERSRHVQDYMKEHGITMEKLVEKHTYPGLMDGQDVTYTTDELLYIYIANMDEMSQAAVMYGNFTTAEEKESVKQHEQKYADKEAIKWFMANAENRFNRVLLDAERIINTDKDLAGLVQVIENDYEKQYERLNRVSIDVFNTPVNRVSAYVPLYRLEQTGDTNEQQVAKDILANTTGTPSNYVGRGMTKNRVEISPTNQKPVQLGLFKTWADSMEKTEHFIAYGELVRDLNAIYTSQAASATREAIASRYGQDANNYIKEYINELANPNKGQPKTALDTLVHVMRGQTAPAYLAWKTSGIIKQLCTSPWPFMAYVSPAEYLTSIGEFIKDWNGMNDFVKSRSVFMANRTIDPIIDLIKEAQMNADNKVKASLASFNKMGMQGLEWADWVSVAPGWYAAYKQKTAEIEKAQKNMDPLADGYKDSEAIEREAIAYADDVVRLTQPSGRKADLSPVFKNSAEIAKILLQFQTSLNVIYQNIRFDLPYQIRNHQYRQAAGAVIGYTAAGILVNAVVSGLFTGDGSDDEPEEKLKRAVFYATTQFTDSVPVVGQQLTNVVQKVLTGEGYYSNSTLFPVVDVLTKTVSDVAKDNYAKAAEDFGEGVAYTLGLPVSGTKELLRIFGIGDNEEGLDFNPEALWGRR